MKRRNLLKASSIFSIAALGGPVLSTVFEMSRKVKVPSLDGELIIGILQPRLSFIESAYAQYYGYGYQSMAPYDQYVAYQIAVQEWNRQLQQWQIQQYQWIQQQQIIALQNAMAQYQNYQIAEQPRPWDSIQSIYGFAVNNNQPTLFGVNSDSDPVAITDTVQGAGEVFAKIGNYFNQSTQEKAVGPQSNEVPAKVVLPDGSEMLGNGYETEYGGLAVTRDTVIDQNGKVGRLAKYELGNDGEQYLIV